MKKTLRFLSMAALVLMGATMTGCTSSELVNEQPGNTADKKVTLTTTVKLNDGVTKALNSTGEKTFAENDQIAVVYIKNGGTTAVAVSEKLPAGTSGKSATFTVTLDDPDKTKDVTFIYPAAMAKENGDINYDALYADQDGTLKTLGSTFDFCTKSGSWNGENLPTLGLENELAILALTLKNDAGGSDITNSITYLTVSDGTHNYTVTRSTGEGLIYVAIQPTSSSTIKVTASNGTTTYVKALSDKTYKKGNGYSVSWKMAEVIGGKFSVSATKQVYFSKGNLQATGTVSGGITTWTWKFAEHQWDKIGGKDQSGTGTPTGNNNITYDGKLSESGTVDLFGWSTSKTYLGIHNSTNNDDYSGVFADWGSHTDVTKGIGTGWYTLKGGEWDYLFNSRSTTSGSLFCKAKVGDHFGIILLPDDWESSYYALQNCNETSARNFDDTNINNKISYAVWISIFEAKGAVFLPCAGQRNSGNVVKAPNGQVHYWSASKGTTDTGSSANANHMKADGNGVAPNTGAGRSNGFSVRLVRDAN